MHTSDGMQASPRCLSALCSKNDDYRLCGHSGPKECDSRTQVTATKEGRGYDEINNDVKFFWGRRQVIEWVSGKHDTPYTNQRDWQSQRRSVRRDEDTKPTTSTFAVAW